MKQRQAPDISCIILIYTHVDLYLFSNVCFVIWRFFLKIKIFQGLFFCNDIKPEAKAKKLEEMTVNSSGDQTTKWHNLNIKAAALSGERTMERKVSFWDIKIFKRHQGRKFEP